MHRNADMAKKFALDLCNVGIRHSEQAIYHTKQAAIAERAARRYERIYNAYLEKEKKNEA